MSELRQDKTTGAWVVISPTRARRPSNSPERRSDPGPVHRFDPACPFCPGNEAQLPGILAETPTSEPPGWSVRVVPNKYPALRADTTPVSQPHAHHKTMGGYGHHEVVIEGPRHDCDLASMYDPQLNAVMSTYRRRFMHLIGSPQIETVVLFRNHGVAGGASLRHPHAQLIALGMIPPRLQSTAAWARGRCEETRRCVTCDELEFERQQRRRIIEETQCFLALVPFAAMVPFEVWLVPKRHEASFSAMDDDECADLGALLRRTLQRLKAVHGIISSWTPPPDLSATLCISIGACGLRPIS